MRKLRAAWLILGAVVMGGSLTAGLTAGTPIRAGGTRVTRRVRSFQEIRQARVVRQKWDLSCGSAALSTLLTRHYRADIPESAIIVWILRRTDPVKVRARGGFSLLNLKRFANSRGFDAEGYTDLSLQELVDFQMPAIVPLRLKGYDHFVVFRGVVGDRVLLADPAYGNVTMRAQRFLKVWRGGIGFIVPPRGTQAPRRGLTPRTEELFIPDTTAVGRIIHAAGAASPTRRR